jgi:succinoglycan biosynthesis transport protein ExoP
VYEEEIDLQQLWQILMKRIWLIIGITVCAMVVAYFASRAMTPIYEAETSFMVKTQGSGLALAFDDMGLMGSSQNVSNNYVQLLKSRTILTRAIKKLGWVPGVDCPEIDDLAKAISAQAIAKTDAITVKVQLADREAARDLADALVDVLIEHNQEMNSAATRTAREYLERQLEISTAELRQAEESMLALKSGRKVVEPSLEAQTQIKRIAELEAQRAGADVTLGELQAKVAKIREQLGGMSDTVVSSETVVEDPVVAQYRRSLAELEVELALAREKYTEQHPEVLRLQAEAAEVKANLSSAVARVVGTQTETPNPMREALLRQIVEAETEMAAARAESEALRRVIAGEEERLSQLPQKELDLARVTRDLEVAQQIYMMLLTKYEEMRVTEQMQISDLWRIDPAALPKNPVKPRKMLNTAIAGILGVFVGVAAAFIIESTDTSIKSAEEVEEILGLPILGTIPIHVGPLAAKSNAYGSYYSSHSSRDTKKRKRGK